MIYQSEALSVNYVTDDIAELIFDASGSVNTLNLSTLENLNEALDALHAQQNLKGLLLRSSKDSFIVGADITEFLNIFSQPSTQLSQWLSHANDIFNKLEDLPVPTISIINGYALGGGCECVLATDFRIAEPKAHIGLPETKLGIMPGFGGTVRLPRLIGADSAMEIITTGKDKKASEALKLGLIDAVVESESLISSAITMLHEAITGKLPWQQRRQQKQKPLTLNKIEATMSFTTAKALITKIAGSHYPAPITAVSTIEQSAQLTRNEALVIEHKNFITLAKTDVAKALISLFLNDQYIKGQTKKATKTVTAPKHCMVLGAGIMGGGIAYQSALKGMPVLMKDINQSSLTLGMNEAAKLLNKQLERGKIDGLQMANTLSSITPTLYNSGAKEADIIVEAVIENPKIKAAVLSEIENQITDKTVITSNTSTIPINLLAQGLKRPENFCGMHFFNPVHRMPLIEIIRGSQTSEATINRVMAYAAKMGKSPIVVNDCPGFFVNRVLFPYFIGFSLLLNDGADYITVDQVMENEFGWPMGPAYLLDVVGIDTAHHAQLVMAESYPSRMSKTQKDAIDVMFEAKRFGQKNGNGFFNYTLDRRGKPKKVITNETRQLLATICQPLNDFNKETIIARMMIPMINEVVRCLEENIIATPAEADMALIYGLGFPPFRGGVFRYLDTLGLANYVTMAEQYTDLGGAYNIPSGLRLKAKNNETYYSTTNVNT